MAEKPRKNDESVILHRLLRLCNTGDVRLFRNQCGRLQDAARKRWIKFGVANPGGADCVGWRSIVITHEMVGDRIAQFVAVETKAAGGKVSEAQEKFLRAVESAGGHASVSRDADVTAVELGVDTARKVW